MSELTVLEKALFHSDMDALRDYMNDKLYNGKFLMTLNGQVDYEKTYSPWALTFSDLNHDTTFRGQWIVKDIKSYLKENDPHNSWIPLFDPYSGTMIDELHPLYEKFRTNSPRSITLYNVLAFGICNGYCILADLPVNHFLKHLTNGTLPNGYINTRYSWHDLKVMFDEAEKEGSSNYIRFLDYKQGKSHKPKANTSRITNPTNRVELLQEIRLLFDIMDHDEYLTFLQIYYPTVYKNVTSTMSRSRMVGLLIDYCERRTNLFELYNVLLSRS